jgi:hypothetical protein
MRVIAFDQLSTCDLIIDAIYEGGNIGNVGDDPINKIIPVGNMGGFRYKGKTSKPQFIVLYTSGENLDWPDRLDTETGIFKYHGDNRKPGYDLHDTKRKGNLILKNLFEFLNKGLFSEIPPIFIFEKHPTKMSKRSVVFKGLCVPGTLQRNQIENLVAIWKTKSGERFQNYLAYFTILNIAKIKRTWLNDLATGALSSRYAPKAFEMWKKKGIYIPLTSERTVNTRSNSEQLPSKKIEIEILKALFEYFDNGNNKETDLFEFFAADIYKMTNSKVIIDEITSSSRDGGRDALGRLRLGLNEDPIFVEFALEAKCYDPGLSGKKINTVGVKEVARLISRIRNRQFGILVTTSIIGAQAYKEVRNDEHPIIFLCGVDIARILIEKNINTRSVLLDFLKKNYPI